MEVGTPTIIGSAEIEAVGVRKVKPLIPSSMPNKIKNLLSFITPPPFKSLRFPTFSNIFGAFHLLSALDNSVSLTTLPVGCQ
jgi:hypothetical protein